MIVWLLLAAAAVLLLPSAGRRKVRRRLERSLRPGGSAASPTAAALPAAAAALTTGRRPATSRPEGQAAGLRAAVPEGRAAGLRAAVPEGRAAGLRAAAPGREAAGRPTAAPVEGRRSRILLALVAGAAVAVLVGGWWGPAAGVAVAVGAERLLRRREPPRLRRERLAASADLPLGADLLAAALRAGAPTDRAAAAVADALGGPLGERLNRTARSLRLGAGPAEAWSHLAGVDGADRLIAAAVRSSASGGALAGALGRLADDLRADRATAVRAAAERVGVLLVLPMGVCFLPAFLLAGLVPVLIAVLGDVL